ncbi:actin-associated protein FAM107A [Alosa sapidissima]|uniref:actin-associated protein FAM107A n=1 Tax=Alosa sapidissima TaxID=34773 RepID=UPI001C09E94D|nr:actin-associated protein FAM107A [Alosa sapidissima]
MRLSGGCLLPVLIVPYTSHTDVWTLTVNCTMLDLGAAKRQAAITVERPGFRHHKKENFVCQSSVSRSATENGEEVTTFRRLNATSPETPSHQGLHRELLLSHKRGLHLEEKPELKRVLEQRRLDQDREQELALRPPSDLEQELRKRQLRLQEYEQEELRRREGQVNIPEFVRVKEKLRHINLCDESA